MKDILIATRGFKCLDGANDDFIVECEHLGNKILYAFRDKADQKAVNSEAGYQWVLQLLGGVNVKGYSINKKRLQGTLQFTQQKYSALQNMEEGSEEVFEFLVQHKLILSKAQKMQGLTIARKDGEGEDEDGGESDGDDGGSDD